MGRLRALELRRGLHAIVADVPLSRCSESAINRELTDLERVSHAALAHEDVIEHFLDATAVLPMKLYTIFDSDERARAHLHAERPRIDAAVKRCRSIRSGEFESSSIVKEPWKRRVLETVHEPLPSRENLITPVTARSDAPLQRAWLT
jgi:hypothetical protein